MPSRPDPRLVHRLRFFTASVAVFTTVVGLSGLAAWTLHIAGLLTWAAAPITMKANTSACFALLGASLWLLRDEKPPTLALRRKIAGALLAATAFGVAFLTMAEHLLRRDFGIDQLLIVGAPALRADMAHPGRMSPLTAAAFMTLSLALIALDWRTRRGAWPAQYLVLAGGGATTFGLFSFTIDPRIYSAHLSMSLPSAVSFMLLSIALACARSRSGLGALRQSAPFIR